MSEDPKEIVARGYDTIAERYAEWAASFESPAMRWTQALLTNIEDGSQILELGCGGGGPVTRALAERHELHGIDISARQIERARERVPTATFICADATELEFEPETFDAVVSLYMLGHVPRAQQAPLLASIASWLRPGGWLLTTMGTAGAEDEVEEDWLGAPMFFASFDEATNRRLLAEVGLDLSDARVIPVEEPGHGLVSFMWILARKPE
jgi:ubiquinone/menaquinone biosynthesis C-methylase UbiE